MFEPDFYVRFLISVLLLYICDCCKGETNDVSICNILSEPIIKQKYLSLEKHGKIIGVNQGKCRFSPIRLARDSSIRSISN